MKSFEEVQADAIAWAQEHRVREREKRRGKRINYTQRAAEDIAKGFHPVTSLPLLGSETCGSCGLAVKVGHGAKDYWKCGAQDGRFVTRSEASDIRRKWPACTGWAPTFDMAPGMTTDELLDK